jgi:hypothetical protein
MLDLIAVSTAYPGSIPALAILAIAAGAYKWLDGRAAALASELAHCRAEMEAQRAAILEIAASLAGAGFGELASAIRQKLERS